MRIVYLNYFCSKKYDKPEDWLAKMQPVNVVLEELAKKHTVISVQQINYNDEIKRHSVDYRFVNFYKKTTLLPFRLSHFVKKLQADVIIIHGTVFPIQTILLKLVVGKSVTIVVQHHAELPFKGIKKMVQKIASFFVDAYFFPSKKTGKIWQAEGNIDSAKPIFTIYEGASTIQQIDRVNARLFTKVNGYPTYIWVGRLDAKKQPLQAIQAFASFLKVQPTARLYMLFYSSNLIEEVASYLGQNESRCNNIILVGKIAHQDLYNWYSSADFYISSSLHEGTSFTLSEAMSCGCVPIVTNIPTLAEMLGNNCGLLYNVGNKNALFEALVASVSVAIEEESSKTLQQYKRHLSPSSIANNIEAALAQLV
ncbi:MAG: glycosyltransferase family 4 protein [Flavobacterium sp.]|nr:glycosyltransferase family 4 protein [Flavobacterium sp.]